MKKKATDTTTTQTTLVQKTRIPNEVIRSYYTNTLIDEQVQTLVLHKATQGQYIDLGEKGGLEITFTAKEFQKVFKANTKGKSLYGYLLLSSIRMNDKKIILEDGKNFVIDSLFPHMEYKNGVMYVRIGELGRQAVLQRKDFTLIDINVIKHLKKVENIRLYEYLREKTFLNKNGYPPSGVEVVEDGSYDFSVSFKELLFRTGVVQIDDKAKVFLCKHPGDYEGVMQLISPDNIKYKNWKDFKKWILDPAIKNISDVSDIEVTYISPRQANEKVINFKVTYKTVISTEDFLKEKEEFSDEEKTNIILDIARLIQEPLPFDEIKAIAKAAEYDMNMIRDKYHICCKQKEKPKNLTAWMISAIKGDYKHPQQDGPQKGDFTEDPVDGSKKEKKQSTIDDFFLQHRSALMDATFFDEEEDVDEEELKHALELIKKENGIPKDAAMEPYLIKNMVQALISWNDRNNIIDSIGPDYQDEDSRTIITENFILFLRCCVKMMTALEPLKYGDRQMTYNQAIDRFNKRLRKNRNYQNNFRELAKRCIGKYYAAAKRNCIINEEAYMYTIIADSLGA